MSYILQYYAQLADFWQDLVNVQVSKYTDMVFLQFLAYGVLLLQRKSLSYVY